MVKPRRAADVFLRDMATGTVRVRDEQTGKVSRSRTNKLIRPDDKAKLQFAETVVTGPEQVERLLRLVQASVGVSDGTQAIIIELTSLALERLGIIALSVTNEAEAYRETISSWLRAVPKRPIPADKLNVLLLLVYFGWLKRLLDEDEAFDLLTAASVRPRQTEPTPHSTASTKGSLLAVLGSASPTESVLPLLVAHHQVDNAAKQAGAAELQAQSTRIENLLVANSDLRTTADKLHTEVLTLSRQIEANAQVIAALEGEVAETRASYQFKLDDLRGRVRGTLQGQMKRWLQTSLDAVRADPPKIAIADERLEDLSILIDEELKWLQRSE